jgi:DNA-binding response OmpR family regulator
MLAGRSSSQPPDPPCVLCIDDDTDFLRALELRLKGRGIHVQQAATGIDGYCLALGQTVNVILLDCQLPNGPGNYILEQLKANSATRDIPVIVITGRQDRELELTMLSQGAEKFIHKPLNFGELMAELHRHLPR